MTKALFPFLLLLFAARVVMAQAVPLQPDNWDFKPGTVEFLTDQSRPCLKILPKAGAVVLKNIDFTDGTIEFDHLPINPQFASMYFHWRDTLESECFYFRTGRAGNPNAPEAVQYAPIVGGVNYWNFLPHYQANADFRMQAWNHVKLVISGKQMRVYVNSESRPTLEIPRLEGNTTHGAIAFDGEAMISNLVLRPNQVEGLSPNEGIDPTNNDPRYIRHWQVTAAGMIPKGIDFSSDLMPGKEAVWQPIDAARRGLVDLTRLYGRSRDRRIAWLKVNIRSDSAQSRKIDLGFLDEVWVFLDGQYLYVDKNYYGRPIMKEPEGRLSIENTSFWVPLKKGDNELLVGVGNYFYGWGIAARLDNLQGLAVGAK
jgi:hypothetical protein